MSKKAKARKGAVKPKKHTRNGKDVTEQTTAATAADVKPQISAGKLKTLLSKARTTRTDSRSLSGQLGQAIADAVENDHLNRKAFNIVKGLDSLRTDPEKLADVLSCVELYLDQSGLQAIADKVLRLPLGEPGQADNDDEEEDEERGEEGREPMPVAAE